MDVILNKTEEMLLKLSTDPETRREYERRAKALSEVRSRLEAARDSGIVKGMEKGIEVGILKVVKGLL
jgi:hypothetical protein